MIFWFQREKERERERGGGDRDRDRETEKETQRETCLSGSECSRNAVLVPARAEHVAY